MPKFPILIAVALALLCSACTRPKAVITFKLTDDDGTPIENAQVSMSTFGHWVPSEGFGRDVSKTVSGKTNKKGIITLTSNSRDGHFSYGAHDVIGYYPGQLSADYQFSSSNLGVWQPHNPTITFSIKRIIKPIPMYARNFGQLPHTLVLPDRNLPIGFDLVAADWVAPYGKGKVSDLIFTLTETIPYIDIMKPFAQKLTVTFSNPLDGIQSFLVPLNTGSLLRSARYAPETGYEPILTKQMGRPSADRKIETGSRDDQNYFFRVRTQLDESGHIKSALYGKIYGDIKIYGPLHMQFCYFLNPISNDRNMEFDPKQNLFGELSFSERPQNR